MIKTFQGLRFLAFVMIFCHHEGSLSGWTGFKHYFASAMGVSFFFMLSGFLLGWKARKDMAKVSVLDKLRKFYPLMIVSMALIILSQGLLMLGREPAAYLKQLACNVLLIQSWFPTGYFSFNGVCWFLSSLMFLYLCSNPIVAGIRWFWKHSKVGLAVCAVICVGLRVVLGIVVDAHSGALNGLANEFFQYIFPPAHLFEYTFAVIVGYWCAKEHPADVRGISFIMSILEGLVFALWIGMLFWPWAVYEWESWAARWILPNIMMLVVFSFGRGCFSLLLGSKVFLWLGGLTMGMYLLHPIVLGWIPWNGSNVSELMRGVRWAGCLAGTILVAFAWTFLMKQRKGACDLWIRRVAVIAFVVIVTWMSGYPIYYKYSRGDLRGTAEYRTPELKKIRHKCRLYYAVGVSSVDALIFVLMMLVAKRKPCLNSK